jgi:hypothetical protein
MDAPAAYPVAVTPTRLLVDLAGVLANQADGRRRSTRPRIRFSAALPARDRNGVLLSSDRSVR